RTWSFGTNSLSIRDEILGSVPHEGVARFILAPSVQVTATGSPLMIDLTAGGRSVIFKSSSPARVEDCTWYPEFGKCVPTRMIAAPVSEAGLWVELIWS